MATTTITGEHRRLVLPFSEVCMHMRVAGQTMIGEAVGGDAVQLHHYGRPFSAPITANEAGWATGIPVTLCPDCGDTVDECSWAGHHPICPACGEPITGCSWNGGRCLDCHENALGPDPCGPGCDDFCPHF